MKISDLPDKGLHDELHHVIYHLNNWYGGEEIDPEMIPVMIKSLANLQLAAQEKKRELNYSIGCKK